MFDCIQLYIYYIFVCIQLDIFVCIQLDIFMCILSTEYTVYFQVFQEHKICIFLNIQLLIMYFKSNCSICINNVVISTR